MTKTATNTKRSPFITLNNGVQMPALGFGVFQSPPEETAAAVETALAQGYRLVDTAAAYLNERQVGEGWRRSRVPREEVFLETKVWISDYGYEATLHAFEKSAAKLGVERLDLLILHQPLPGRFDLTLDAYRALEKLFGDGRARADDPTLQEIGRRHCKSPAQVMLRWHLQQGRCAIPKSTKPARIAENFDVFDFELLQDEIAAIDALFNEGELVDLLC